MFQGLMMKTRKPDMKVMVASQAQMMVTLVTFILDRSMMNDDCLLVDYVINRNDIVAVILQVILSVIIRDKLQALSSFYVKIL